MSNERNLSNATTLHSMENTPAQKYHRDFNPGSVSKLKPGSIKPASLLLCIQEGTSLVIRGIEHVIPLGFAILFNVAISKTWRSSLPLLQCQGTHVL